MAPLLPAIQEKRKGVYLIAKGSTRPTSITLFSLGGGKKKKKKEDGESKVMATYKSLILARIANHLLPRTSARRGGKKRGKGKRKAVGAAATPPHSSHQFTLLRSLPVEGKGKE